MTLLTTVFAAIISTVIWYKGAPDSKMQVGALCWMYWGASLMWFIDAVFDTRNSARNTLRRRRWKCSTIFISGCLWLRSG